MRNRVIRPCLLVLVVLLALFVELICIRAEQANVKVIPLAVDSMPKAKVIENMQIVGNRLCLVYEHPTRWGSQQFCTFRILESEKKLVFDDEFLRTPAESNGIDYPLLFMDDAKHCYIADKTYPLVYTIDLNRHLMQNTHRFIISPKSKVPYAMSLNVSDAYRCSDRESFFVGRQPNNGFLGLYQSMTDSVSCTITEVRRLMYSSRYPAWTANYGKDVFCAENHKLAHGFYLFPAIQLVDLKTGQSLMVKLTEPNLKLLKLNVGDVWEVNPMQIKDVTATRKMVYALWWGKRLSLMNASRQKNRANCRIVVFDWTGEQRKTYEIPRYISGIAAISDGKLIATDGKHFYLLILTTEK